MKAWVEKNERYVFFLVVLTGLLAVVFFYRVGVSQEAVVRVGVGSALLAGLVEGRQGLIGSLKWPPLPTLQPLSGTYRASRRSAPGTRAGSTGPPRRGARP